MTRKESRRLKLATGEELLVLAVLGDVETVDAIDVELDRRAHAPRTVRHRRRSSRRLRRPAA